MLLDETDSSVESFLTETATDIVSKLDDDDKQFLLENPDYTEHHFGFGLWIRNTYIHDHNLPVVFCQPDELSALVFDRVIQMLSESDE